MQHSLLSGTDLQRQTLRLYGEFVSRRESWAGKLVFACGEGSSANGLAAAVSIAGGTSLVVDPDAAVVKAVFRQGGVDFVVNTLDEALRVLKNEIRKGRPLGVALVAEVEVTVAQMAERGVLPDLIVSFGEMAELEQAGMDRLRFTRSGGMLVESDLLVGWLQHRGWSEVVIESGTGLRERDARLETLLPDALRKTWVQRIGHYQRLVRGGARAVWLSEAERASGGI